MDFALVFTLLLGSGNIWVAMAFLLIGFMVIGLTSWRATARVISYRSSLYWRLFFYNVAAIIGASVAPHIAAWLTVQYGLLRVSTCTCIASATSGT
ncbi:MAG: hypothetical protein GPOALKHO_001739 [Sodalis sp.]|nr:MAG: hypothetical protein GPOALKHO_001739 [Sodalis sp.]